MILESEIGRIALTQRNEKIFARADGIVGIEAIEEYLYLLYPNANNPLREAYLSAINQAVFDLLRLVHEGGLLTYRGALAIGQQIDPLPEELLERVRQEKLMYLRSEDLVRQFDPNKTEQERLSTTPVYLFAPEFREGVGYRFIPKGGGRAYTRLVWLKDEIRFDIPIPPFSNAVKREYKQLGIPENPIIPSVTVARQFMFDIARIWGRGQVERG